MAYAAWRWSRGRREPGVPGESEAVKLEPELERTLDEELARFES